MDSTPSRRLRQYSAMFSAPGNRAAIPTIAMSFSWISLVTGGSLREDSVPQRSAYWPPMAVATSPQFGGLRQADRETRADRFVGQ